MFKPTEVEARPNYRLWIRYKNGAEGEVDLSDLVGQGVFTLWEDEAEFKRVSIGQDGAISWTDEIELCPDAIYMKLTGKKPEIEALP